VVEVTKAFNGFDIVVSTDNDYIVLFLNDLEVVEVK
jgi:hypothetical protein